MNSNVVILVSLVYIGILFLIAFLSEKNKKIKHWVKNSSIIYSLSLAVYCTAWTYYGSIGRASETGIGFLPIYLGPTLMAPFFIIILKKFILICEQQGINSLADFIASRYGKSPVLGAMVAIIAIIGIVPYISLQLKAINISFNLLISANFIDNVEYANVPFYLDTAFYVAVILIIFTIFFGAKNLQSKDKNIGIVTAIAFESVLKLIAFLACGIYVTYIVFNGFGDIFTQAIKIEEIKKLFTFNSETLNATEWFSLTLLSFFAITILPRQFHIGVIENSNVKHVNTAMWLFPLYMFVINIFVLPVAIGGLLIFGNNSIDADTFLLSIPLYHHHYSLALIVFLGGLSAAISMVVVATIALAIMFNNNILVPVLLNLKLTKHIAKEKDIYTRLIELRRLIIVIILMFAYFFYVVLANNTSLVSLGLISFTAIAQFVPAVFGALFWHNANKKGVIIGLLVGFVVWAYTLPFPFLAENDLISKEWISNGLWHISWLKPYELFGLKGFSKITNAFFWSLGLNSICFTFFSLFTKQTAIELSQADKFINASKKLPSSTKNIFNKTAKVYELQEILFRFLGKDNTKKQFEIFSQRNNQEIVINANASLELIDFSEQLLNSVIGAASSTLVINSITKSEDLKLEKLIELLDETRSIKSYNKKLQLQSKELKKLTTQLTNANEKLKMVDELKDDFITTVSHELRTPITSIKSLSKIMYDTKNLESTKQKQFLSVIVKESDRIARLVTQILDWEQIETGNVNWSFTKTNLNLLLEDVVKNISTSNKTNALVLKNSEESIFVNIDYDRIAQVVINIITNAIKFTDVSNARIEILTYRNGKFAIIEINDNGIGIAEENLKNLFDRFTQFGELQKNKPSGSGLGLSISKKIVEEHKGKIVVKSKLNVGTTFYIYLPNLMKSGRK